MKIIEWFVSNLTEFYTLPLEQYKWSERDYWNGEVLNGPRDWGMTLFLSLLIYGGTILCIILIASLAVSSFWWHKNRQRCQHSECDTAWTLEVSELTDEPGCIEGHACCDECHDRHLRDALQRRAEAEDKILCPRCGNTMHAVPNFNLDIILNTCTLPGGCKGVFFDEGELDLLLERVEEEGLDWLSDDDMTTLVATVAALSVLNTINN